MLGKHHLQASLALGTATFAILNQPSNIDWATYGLLMTGVGWGSIYPDYDTPKSLINIFLDNMFSSNGHRGESHSWGYLILHTCAHLLVAYLTLGIFWSVGSIFFSLIHFRLFLCNFHFGFWTPIILKLILGFGFGYFLHMLEDSWSVGGILWTGVKSDNYDKWVLENLGMYNRKPLKTLIINNKRVPIRHKWGRGYRVGSTDEDLIVVAIILFSVFLFWLRQKPMIDYAIHLVLVAVHWTLIITAISIALIIIGSFSSSTSDK